MQVRVEFYGPLRRQFPDQEAEVEPGTTVAALLDRLGVTDRYMAVLVDGLPFEFSDPLPPGTRTVMLVPPIGGGGAWRA